MKHERFPCGCTAERGTGCERWTALCPAHRAEVDELHRRHLQDLRAKREREQQ